MASTWLNLWRKEVREELYTWKSMLWLLVVSLIFSVTSYLFLTNKELNLLDQTELLWLFSKIILGVAFLIVAIDASSIIATEFEKETAESLFLTPMTLRAFLFGKFLASLTLWAAIFIVALPYIVVTASGTTLILPFIGYIALFGTLGIGALIMIVFATSLLYRSTKNTLTTSLILLLALFIPALFSSTLKNNAAAQLFGKINPVDAVFSSLDNILVDYQLSLVQQWQYLLPLLVFLFLAILFLFFAAWRFQRQGIIDNA